MERRLDTTQRDAARTTPYDSDKTALGPHATAPPLFDAAAVRHARPAEPLTAARRARSWPFALVLMVAAAAAVGGLVGGVVATLYQSGPLVQTTSGARQQTAAESPSNPATERQVADSPADAETQQDAPSVQPDAAASEEVRASNTEAPAPPDANDARAPVKGGDAQAELRDALDRWVAATNARNVERQMNFYGERVSAFYLTRNATRERVRAEKSRVIGGASAVNVSAGEPDISVSPDGRTATMRFRKRYQIDGGGSRRGEVLQELRWRRSSDGNWRIVSERDLRVLN